MPFGQPDAVEPAGFGGIGHGEGLLECGLLRVPVAVIAFHYQAEVHLILPELKTGLTGPDRAGLPFGRIVDGLPIPVNANDEAPVLLSTTAIQ